MDVIESEHYELEEHGDEDEITQDDAWAVVSAYFDEKGLRKQLDSFENFQNISQEMAADIEVQPDPTSQSHSAEEISPVVIAQATKVFVNGSWVGIHRNPEMLVRALMKLRRRVDINTEVCVVRYIHHKELHIYTDCGRCSLPLFIVDNRLLIEKRDIFQGESLKNSGWRDLAENGFIAAEETTMISMTINDVVQSRLNPVEAYWNTCTHCEIHSVSTVNGKLLTGDGPHHEDTPLNVSSPVNRSISGNDLLTENVEEAKGDSDIGETSATFTSVKGSGGSM